MLTLAYCARCEKWNTIDAMVAVREPHEGDEEPDELATVCRGTCVREGEETGTIAMVAYQAEPENN